MKKIHLLGALLGTISLLMSCETNGTDGTAATNGQAATAATTAAVKTVKDVFSAATPSQRSARANFSMDFSDTVTITSDLGGTSTAVCALAVQGDDATGVGTIKGTVDITFDAFKVDVDGVTYTIGGALKATMDGDLMGAGYTMTQKGTMTLTDASGVSGSYEIDLTMVSTTSGTTQTMAVTGTVGGEAVNETETFDTSTAA